jgi:hypothetical protein
MGKGWPVWPARPAWPAFGGLEASRSALPTRCPRQCAFPPAGFTSTSDLANTPSPQAVTLKTRVPRSLPGRSVEFFVVGLSSSGVVCVFVPTIFISCRSFPHRRLLSKYLLYRILIPTVAPAQRHTQYPTCIPVQTLPAVPFARRTHFGPATALSVRFTTHLSNSRTRGGALAATGTPSPCPSRGRVPSGTTI